MKKRMEKDPNDTEALGLSRSELRNLDAAEAISRELDPIQREIDNIRDAQRGLGFDASRVDTIARAQADARLDPDEARVDLDEARVSLDDVRVDLDDFRPGPISNMLPSTSEMLKGQAESVRASLYRPPSLLRENVVKSLAKPPIPPFHISQMIDTRSRIQGMFRTLPEVAVKPSAVLPAASMARFSDVARGVAASEISKNRQGIYSLLETVNRSFSKSLATQIMATR